MRDYGKISTRLWRSRKFRALPCDEHRLFYVYLHTCPHVNSLGCFVLPRGYAVADLGWPAERVGEAIESLSRAGLIAFNEVDEVVRIVDFLEHDPPTNEKHALGVAKGGFALPDCAEKLVALKELASHRYARKLDALAEAIDRLSRAYRNPEPEPEPEPIQDTSLRSVSSGGVPTDLDSEVPFLDEPSDRAEAEGADEPRPEASCPLQLAEPAEPDPLDGAFAVWWSTYPRYRRGAKGPARKKWLSLVRRRKATPEQLQQGLDRYNAAGYATSRFAQGAEAWLNGEQWTVERFPPPSDAATSHPLREPKPSTMETWRNA